MSFWLESYYDWAAVNAIYYRHQLEADGIPGGAVAINTQLPPWGDDWQRNTGPEGPSDEVRAAFKARQALRADYPRKPGYTYPPILFQHKK